MLKLPKKVRLEVWFGGYTELFNAEFVQSVILVTGVLVQVQNTIFFRLTLLRCFPP